MFWGQTGRNRFARSVSFQGATVTGGMNLRLPRGGVAKGMPRKVATGWRVSVGCWRTPCTGPYLVATFLKQRTPSEISGLRSTSRYASSASCWISEIKWIPSKDAWKLLAPSVLSCCLKRKKEIKLSFRFRVHVYRKSPDSSLSHSVTAGREAFTGPGS